MKKILASVAGLALLSGCMQVAPAEITEPPVSASLVSPALQERLAQGTSKMTVRAYKPVIVDGKQTRQEVVGAKCSLVSDELRASVVTPQEVIMPKFKQRKEYENRGVPGSVVVSCRNGSERGQALVTVQEKQVSTVGGLGLAGVLVSAAVTAAAANSTPWSFPLSVGVTIGE